MMREKKKTPIWRFFVGILRFMYDHHRNRLWLIRQNAGDFAIPGGIDSRVFS